MTEFVCGKPASQLGDESMRRMNMFLACQRLNSGTNLRECEDQSWFKFQAVPVFRFDCYEMLSRTT
jgi:hypothetical protein